MTGTTEVLLVSAMHRDEFLRQSARRRAAGDLGIRYLAAWLQKHGIGTDILPDHLHTPAELVARLTSSPGLQLVGFSLHTATLDSGLASIELCRRLRPDVPVVIGGYHPTFAGGNLLGAGVDVDYVIQGEAEQSLLALAQSLRSGSGGGDIPGVIHASGGASVPTVRGALVPLDTLPMPMRTRSDMPETSEVMVSASRGCYGSCTFCSIPVFGRSGWRGRSPEHVADEVALLRRDFGAEFIDFVDDSLFGPRDALARATELRDAFAARDLRIPFRVSIRPNDVVPEIIDLLRACGLVAVQLGVESFSERQLRLYHKRTTPAMAQRAIRVLEDAGVHVQTGLILFEPSTTLADLRENALTLENEGWAVAKGNTSSLFAAQGTRLARDLVARGDSLGLDRFLNHRWAFQHEEVERVHQALVLFDRRQGGLGEVLVDAVTPPQPELAVGAAREVRAIQNRFQRASFHALALACDEAETGLSSAQILAALRAALDDQFGHIRERMDELLPGHARRPKENG